MGARTGEAVVVPLPTVERSCWSCVHSRVGGPLTICTLTGEPLLDERSAAAECDEFTSQD